MGKARASLASIFYDHDDYNNIPPYRDIPVHFNRN